MRAGGDASAAGGVVGLGLVGVAVALVAGAGCDRPRPLIFCHNANCTGDAAPSDDDTIDGLRRALALSRDGEPVIDGVELDLVWDAPRDRCAFAHDVDAAPDHADAAVAVDEIVAWSQGRAGAFGVHLDLKPGEDAEALAACALRELDRLSRAGVTVRIGSAAPGVLEAVAASPLAAGRDLHLVAGFGTPRPLGSTEPLSAFAGVALDAVAVHPRWITAQTVAVTRDVELELTLWTHVLSVETLDAIERWSPAIVTTGDVALLRAWVDR